MRLAHMLAEGLVVMGVASWKAWRTRRAGKGLAWVSLPQRRHHPWVGLPRHQPVALELPVRREGHLV